MNVPHLKLGKGFIGPEFSGCCNSGMRPVMLRLGKPQYAGKYKYIVGNEIDIWSLTPVYLKLMEGFKGYKMVIDKQTIVFVYQTRTAALRKFENLCKSVKAYNHEVQKEVENLQNKSKNGDLESTLSLGLDHGEI